MPNTNIIQAQNFSTFMLAGNAVFTVTNATTGNHFTFKVKRGYADRNPTWYVKVKSKSPKWVHLGTISGFKFRPNEIMKEKRNIEVTAFAWLFKQRRQLARFPTVKIYHEGGCARCGRTLTLPESIECGFGKTCAKLLDVEYGGPLYASAQ